MGMPLIGLFLMLIWVDACALPVLGSSVMVSVLLQRRLPWQYTNDNPIRPPQHSPFQTDTVFSPEQAPPSFNKKNYNLNAAPPMMASQVSSFQDKSPAKDLHQRTPIRPSSIAISPSALSPATHKKKWGHGPAFSSSHKSTQARNHINTPKAAYPIPPPTPHQTGPSVSPFHSPSSLSSEGSPLHPALSPSIPTNHFNELSHPPVKSPLTVKTPPSRTLTLPPPPPNEDCALIACTEPLTNTPAGSPCGCVWPIQVKLQLGVSMYSLFNMVTELTDEIAASVSLNHSQVRIMGANAGSQQLEECTVLINLVPREDKFDGTTAFSIYKKFWTKQLSVKTSLFGPYQVLYVHYPGLPPSPPSVPSSTSIMDEGPDHGSDSNGRMNKPLGVKVPKRKQEGLGMGMIIIVVLSSLTALVICATVAWLLLVKCGIIVHQDQQIPQALQSKTPKQTEATTGPVIFRSMAISESVSYNSGAIEYTGAAKMFTLIDIEKATNKFDASRILGEGGFGVVYSGVLEDGKMVAVKVLKREDQHGNREFLAEFEMLGRLHHRNLVKLIGICTEGHTRCLVYELIPNGSVESHLHGVDKESDPLDWDARMKIALGAARALAYLHEDSNPCVIHRDFKSSNILLEHDYTPKVSDFGLARAAIDEANKYISTHVMGTFGYLAPEYAMTGHLLVKSDVYSYGVVLLELLTGRKPVDLSQPPGQENLVGYARPLLTSKDGLEEIIDPAIRSTVSLDTISRVAAIASMCVQSEVSHRPFMGEVVQALKLVCNEFDETEMQRSRNCSCENLLIDLDDKNIRVSAENMDVSLSQNNPLPLSTPHSLTMGMRTEGQEYGPLRRHSDSGPLRVAERKHFWQKLSSSRGSRSEHGLLLKLWPGTG